MRLVFLGCVLALAATVHAELVSGELIPVGTPDGRGPLAAHAVVTEPVGAVHVTGGDAPDLFVRTTRFGRDRGLFLYPFSSRAEDGTPVFGPRQPAGHPFDEVYPPEGHVFTDSEGAVHGLWLEGGKLVHTVFNRDRMAFERTGETGLAGLPRGPGAVAAMPAGGGAWEVLLQIGDGTRYRDWAGSTRDPQYDPYDGRGIWRGGLPYVSLWAVAFPEGLDGPASHARRVSATDREVRFQFGRITPLALTGNGYDVLTGSRFGRLHFYANTGDAPLSLAPRRAVTGEDGIALRHPIIHPTPVSYPNTETGTWTDIIAGGEGGLYWYRYTGRMTREGHPVFHEPVPVLEESAGLFAGTLPVPNVVDWDGDGDQDIVAGNSEGFILFFENLGNNTAPAFAPGAQLTAGGEVIHVQPGYRLDIQGPGEARWGYVCPTVVDWDRDGLLDIVMSDSTARHTVFLNEGTAGQPRLARGKPIYYDGLELFGTWRVQPAAGELGGRMAYIALDDDDAFHLYWQEDARNVTDGGKLRLDDGRVIGANFLHGGGTGRLKVRLYDWDQDGLKDLIVGTPRHASVPDPEHGLPQSLGLPGSAVLFLKNTGTPKQPVFATPKLFAYKGYPIFLGQHACGAAPADFGDGGVGLVAGEESGRLLYYAREDLSVITPRPEGYPREH